MLNLLYPTENICYFCRSEETLDRMICINCLEFVDILNRDFKIRDENVDKAYYSLMYNRFIKDKISDYKFNNKSYLYKALAEFMIGTIDSLDLIDKEEIDLIGYIPAHRRKEAKRGYNQSKLLAKYIAKYYKIEFIGNNIIKIRHTKEQNKLDAKERLYNLEASFKVRNRDKLKGKNILLIDDIITTGSTFKEVGKELKGNKANKVIALALTSSKRL